jgi:ribulose-phosphate 3-epimerase
VDGGVTGDTAAACVAAGANVLTAGTFVYAASDYAAPVAQLRSELAKRWTLA